MECIKRCRDVTRGMACRKGFSARKKAQEMQLSLRKVAGDDILANKGEFPELDESTELFRSHFGSSHFVLEGQSGEVHAFDCKSFYAAETTDLGRNSDGPGWQSGERAGCAEVMMAGPLLLATMLPVLLAASVERLCLLP